MTIYGFYIYIIPYLLSHKWDCEAPLSFVTKYISINIIKQVMK